VTWRLTWMDFVKRHLLPKPERTGKSRSPCLVRCSRRIDCRPTGWVTEP